MHAALGLVVEKLFSYKGTIVIATEGRALGTPVSVVKEVTTKRTGDAPAEKPATKNGMQLVSNRTTAAT